MNHLTPTEIFRCSGSQCKSFLNEQIDRFEHLEDDPIPLTDGSLLYCETIPESLFLINFLRGEGHMAHLLWDLDLEEHLVHTNLEMENLTYD
jgi:hypothetical protein